MISSYVIYDDKITLRDFLKSNHLSNSNIYKLSVANSFYRDNENINLDTFLYKNDVLFINYSLVENSFLDNKSYINDNTMLDVLYEDSEIIAVYKKGGILVHSDGSLKVTLLDYVSEYLQKKGDDSVVRCLHRLDVDTSGIVVFTKNILAMAYLSNQMEENKIEKEYLAYVTGLVLNDGHINIGIGKDRHNSKKSIAIKKGKYAYTEYKVLKGSKDKSLLSIKIKTGRTHQIRVHMAYIKHPVVGDSLYGKKGSTLMLMCKRMELDLFKKRIIIDAKREF